MYKINPIEPYPKTKDQLYRYMKYNGKLTRNKEGKTFKEVLNDECRKYEMSIL